jgi:hypothetical protein
MQPDTTERIENLAANTATFAHRLTQILLDLDTSLANLQGDLDALAANLLDLQARLHTLETPEPHPTAADTPPKHTYLALHGQIADLDTRLTALYDAHATHVASPTPHSAS